MDRRPEDAGPEGEASTVGLKRIIAHNKDAWKASGDRLKQLQKDHPEAFKHQPKHRKGR